MQLRPRRSRANTRSAGTTARPVSTRASLGGWGKAAARDLYEGVEGPDVLSLQQLMLSQGHLRPTDLTGYESTAPPPPSVHSPARGVDTQESTACIRARVLATASSSTHPHMERPYETPCGSLLPTALPPTVNPQHCQVSTVGVDSRKAPCC